MPGPSRITANLPVSRRLCLPAPPAKSKIFNANPNATEFCFHYFDDRPEIFIEGGKQKKQPRFPQRSEQAHLDVS